MKKQVLYGFKHETLEAKIKWMLSLPLAKRYSYGLAKGKLAKILEKNQERLYGRGGFKHIQILDIKDVKKLKRIDTLKKIRSRKKGKNETVFQLAQRLCFHQN